jgi:hypothetical protein
MGVQKIRYTTLNFTLTHYGMCQGRTPVHLCRVWENWKGPAIFLFS